ncbi:hypothetical protein HK102_002839, partial [Quaeritorhiza haematococci]
MTCSHCCLSVACRTVGTQTSSPIRLQENGTDENEAGVGGGVEGGVVGELSGEGFEQDRGGNEQDGGENRLGVEDAADGAIRDDVSVGLVDESTPHIVRVASTPPSELERIRRSYTQRFCFVWDYERFLDDHPLPYSTFLGFDPSNITCLADRTCDRMLNMVCAEVGVPRGFVLREMRLRFFFEWEDDGLIPALLDFEDTLDVLDLVYYRKNKGHIPMMRYDKNEVETFHINYAHAPKSSSAPPPAVLPAATPVVPTPPPVVPTQPPAATPVVPTPPPVAPPVIPTPPPV